MSQKIVFVRANSFRSEPRLIKEYNSAKKYQRYLVLWNRDDIVEPMENAHIMTLNAPFGQMLFIFYLPIWFVFTIIQLLRIRPKIIHACDLACIIPSYIYKSIFFKRTKLIYDIWDATIGHFPTKRKRLRRFIINCEKYFIAKSDIVLVPDEERKAQLEIDGTKLADKVVVIYNSDTVSDGNRKINLKNKSIMIAYVGVMSKNIRGLEQIVYAAKKLPEIKFVIAGYGPDGEYLKKVFEWANLPNLKFIGRLSHQEAEELNKRADIMISLLDHKYENYRYATSTKVFEAFKLLKPVITSKYTATGNLVERVGWGEVIKYNENELVKCLLRIQKGEITFDLKSEKVRQYSWDKMAKRLNTAYAYLLGELPDFK